MLDLLAAIVPADPPALLAWLVLAFAASGYPLGIMLGSSCSPCCNSNPCTQCTEGELPETLTVTFNGLQDRTPGPDLCLLTFSAPYGSGAAGKVTAPGGDPATDKGPISSVSLTNGGSGYAKLGRVAPTITASGGSGTGATFSVTTTSTNDANGIPSWSVTGVTFTGTTSGYGDGDQIAFDVATGDTAEQGAAATIHTVRTAPTVTASVPDGTGATLSVTTAANGTTPQTWSVTGVTVTNGGSGYPSTGAIAFEIASGDTEVAAASAIYHCDRTEPTVSLSVDGAGTGAVIQPTLTYYADGDFWYVSGVTISNGGSGYAAGDPVAITLVDGDSDGVPFSMTVNVDGSGAVIGVTVDNPFPSYAPWNRGSYYVNAGIIQSVTLSSGGTYYRDSDEIASISVEAGGTYYREDASATPYVAAVTVGVSQTAPSNGTGATLTATVNSDTASADFGKIASVSITNGGTNYLAWEWRNTKCCGDHYNGLSVVVKRLNYGDGNACRYSHRFCGVGNIRVNVGEVEVFYNGPTTPPTLFLQSELPPDGGTASSICNTSFTASGNVTNCSDWSGVSFSASGGRTATVEAGGEYDPLFRNPGGRSCFICCRGNDVVPAEVAIDITDNRGTGLSGTYIRPLLGGPFSNGTQQLWANFWSGGDLGLGVWLESDIEGCNDCGANCRIQVSFNPFGVFAGTYNNSGNSPCVSVPVCNPYGSFTLCAYGDCDTYGTYDADIGPA